MPDCLEMPYMPAVRGAETIEDAGTDVIKQDNVYRLGGNSCLSGDFMGYWRFPGGLGIGDNVIFEDMLHYQWSWNYIVGLRFQWNVSSFYTKKNNIRNIEVNKNMVNVQKERFIYENNLQQSQTNAAINQMLEIMQDDDRIIELRTKIRIASESKWQNGIITMSELLKDITNETNARLDKSIHELEWLKKIYELKSITNN